MHNRDSRVLSLPGIGKRHFFSFIYNLTAVFEINAGQNLHKRGFTGSVLTHQRMNLAPAYFQVYLFQSMDSGKGFIDILHRQNYFPHFFTFHPFSFRLNCLFLSC